MTSHLCHVPTCTKGVPPKMLMCATHWRQVPKPLQSQVWATYRSGQEADKNPSEEYIVAANAAIAAVMQREKGKAHA